MSFAAVAVGVSAAATVAGAATSAATSASAADAQSSAAKKAADMSQGNNIIASILAQAGADKAGKRLNPYAGLGQQAAGALSSAAFGSPESVFQSPLLIADIPKRGMFANAKDYNAAMKDWRQQYKALRQEAAGRGVQMPALSTFVKGGDQPSLLSGLTGMKTQPESDPEALRQFVQGWNLKQQPMVQLQQNLASQGITNADQYRAYLDKTGQFGPGDLTRNYTVDQYNAENGTNFNMKDALTPYTTQKYQEQWGVDPTSLLSPGDFQASPDYQFRKEQGMAGIEQGAAGRGSLLSGATLKALNDYNSNLASGEYANWWNRDMQNRQAGLQNFWNANTKDAQDRGMQYAGFADAFNRNQTNKGQYLSTLNTLLGAGQNAATSQGNWDYGAGSTMANIAAQNGQQQAGYQLQQGQITANQMANTNNAIQGGLSNLTSLASLYGGGYFGGGKGGTGGGSGSGGGIWNPNAINTSNGLNLYPKS